MSQLDRLESKLDRVAESCAAIRAHWQDTMRRLEDLAGDLSDHIRADAESFARLAERLDKAPENAARTSLWRRLAALAGALAVLATAAAATLGVS